MKDHSGVEEAVKMSVAVFLVLQNINNLFLISHAQGRDTKDLTTLYHFANLVSNQDQTLQAKVRRATEEIAKIVTCQEDERSQELREAIIRILNNADISQCPIQMPMVMQPMMPPFQHAVPLGFHAGPLQDQKASSPVKMHSDSLQV